MKPRAFFPAVAAVRPYLALKGTLLLLTFDMWLTRASHAGRYGAGGFNVAHWPWLDWVQPQISPPLYVGTCVLTSLLSFAIVVGNRPPRWLLGLTLGVHTWSWAMSMLDSYQHHYLLSLVLLCFVFFPTINAEEALRFDDPAPPPPKDAGASKDAKSKPSKRRKKRKKRKKSAPEEPAPIETERSPQHVFGHALLAPAPRTSAWAYGLLAASVSVVYAFTALSKTAPEWLSGASLQRVIHYPTTGAPSEDANVIVRLFHTLAEADGNGGQTFFYLMGHSVVLVQLICMAGYLLAPWRDATKSRWMKGFFAIAMLTALSFHFGAELMGLEIGWFGYYMIGYALIFFLPAKLLVALSRAVLLPQLTPLPARSWAIRVLLLIAVLAVRPALNAVYASVADSPELANDALGSLSLGLCAGIVAYRSPGLAVRFAFALVIAGAGFLLEWTLPFYIAGVVILLAPLRGLVRTRWVSSVKSIPAEAALGAVGVAELALVGVGWSADLPGTQAATILGAVLLGFAAIVALLKDGHARSLLTYAIGGVISAGLLFGSLTGSDMRWDYWRNVGGDHRRRGEVEEAYIAYVMANRYAPEGEDRHEKEAEMRAILVQRGLLDAEGGE